VGLACQRRAVSGACMAGEASRAAMGSDATVQKRTSTRSGQDLDHLGRRGPGPACGVCRRSFGDAWQISRHAPGRRTAHAIRSDTEGLEDARSKQFEQRFDLLDEIRQGSRPPKFRPARSVGRCCDRAGQEHRSPLHFARLAGDLDGPIVMSRTRRRRQIGGQPNAVAAKVWSRSLGARRRIRAMGPGQVGLEQVQLVDAAFERHA